MDSVAEMIQSVMTPITHWMLITWFILNRGYWINRKHSMRLFVAILIWIDFMNCHWNDNEKRAINSLLKKAKIIILVCVFPNSSEQNHYLNVSDLLWINVWEYGIWKSYWERTERSIYSWEAGMQLIFRKIWNKHDAYACIGLHRPFNDSLQ